MKLQLIRHLWGVTDPWEEVFPKFVELGFTGIEAPLPEAAQTRRFKRLLKDHDLAYVPQIFTAGADVAEHVESFRAQLDQAAGFDPLRVNAHSGRDAWSEVDACRFFEAALEIEMAAGLPVAHETHRGRILYNPWITDRLIESFDALRLCCDFSHWVCVGERLIDDQLEIVQRSAERCIHLHARVGYEQGPQVPDPRAPEHALHVEAHERWWRMVWEAQRSRGDKVSTLTPEFGPPGYQHTLPFTRAPVGDLWEICHWQARRQAENFAAWQKGS
jgi:hypothetical protein